MRLSHSLRTSIPGPRSLALWAREEAIIAPGLQSVTQWARVSFSHGQGAVLWDVDGNGIIDFMAGIGVCSIGHAHPAHAAAVAQQAARLAAGSFTSEARVELLEGAALNPPGASDSNPALQRRRRSRRGRPSPGALRH